MNKLLEIDNKITEQLSLLKEIITKDDFQLLCEFELNKLDLIKSQLEKTKKVKGIYLFEIYKSKSLNFSDWVYTFKFKFRGNKEGENERNGKFLKQWTPNIVNSRILNKPENESEWVPLYIGKSNNIFKRINEHIYSKLGIPPSALKLKDRENLIDEKFRIKYIPFPSNISEYETLAVELEKKLRKEIIPISGK